MPMYLLLICCLLTYDMRRNLQSKYIFVESGWIIDYIITEIKGYWYDDTHLAF